MNPSQLSGRAQKLFKMIEFDENERLIAEIRKHPFGLFLIYFTGLFVTTALFAVFIVVPGFFSGDPLDVGRDLRDFRPLAAVIGGILMLLSLLITAVGAYLYQSNVVILTSEKLAQVLYRTIFDRKISQLSIGDVQDVTVSQRGVLAHAFNYGTLVIETAGEQQNLTFTFVPHPYEASKLVVGAHEENLKLYGN